MDNKQALGFRRSLNPTETKSLKIIGLRIKKVRQNVGKALCIRAILPNYQA